MKGIRAGVVTAVLAGMCMLGGCSEEPAGPAGSPSSAAGGPEIPSAPPSTAAARPSDSPAAAPSSAAAPAEDTRSPEERIAAGRSTYNANCIACHNIDPRKDGTLGPAVAGASFELLEARIMRGEYPAGYVAKRETKVMVPLPHLQSKLPELAAYLGSLQ